MAKSAPARPRLPWTEATHRVHDYRRLIARWRAVARAAGLRLTAFARAGDYPVYYLEVGGGRERDAQGGFYASAGIHGDEPAGPEGLLVWAEHNLAKLVRRRPTMPLLILPCLNPWGLVNNHRCDEQGRDLNRLFDRKNFAPIRELKALLGKRRFDLGLSLHEDYDGQGVYLYEINRRAPDVGLTMLRACAAILPIDRRRTIDGRPFKEGRALRRANLERIPLHPETIYLYLNHGDHMLTVETPSEFALGRRVQAQVLLIEESIRWLEREKGK